MVTIGGGADVEGGSSSATTVGTGVVIVLSAERSTDTDPYDYCISAHTCSCSTIVSPFSGTLCFVPHALRGTCRSPHITRLTLHDSLYPP